MHVLPGQGGGQRGGAVPGVEDGQRRPAVVPGRTQPAEQVPDLPGGLVRAAGLGGAHDIGDGGPRGAQVPESSGELVLPAGDRLAGAVTAARVMMDMLAARGAFGVRPRVGGRVDREPQPPPPGARLAHRAGIFRREPGQRGFQQPVIDHVVLRGPRLPVVSVDELRQRPGQQPGQGFPADLAGGQRVIQRAVPASELRLPRQLDQRGHRVIGAQDRIRQLEQRIGPGGKARIQPGAELTQRQEPRDRLCRLRRVRRPRCRLRAGTHDRLQPPARSWECV